MRHLDEATVLAVRDGAPVEEPALTHVAECATCAAALTAAHERAESIARTLTALDRPVEPTAAKAGVRARLPRSGQTVASARWKGRHLGRAAALVLVAAGAAAAFPQSPLRDLWRPSVPDPLVEPQGSSDVVTAPSAPFAETSDVGIVVGIPDGLVHVSVRGALPGTEISVDWTEQTSARVTAPAGSRFTYSTGRVEVDVARGTIRVELPRAGEDVSLVVDGRVYLEGSPGALEIWGPTVENGEHAIAFVVPGG